MLDNKVLFPYHVRCHYQKTCCTSWHAVDRTKCQIPLRKAVIIIKKRVTNVQIFLLTYFLTKCSFANIGTSHGFFPVKVN